MMLLMYIHCIMVGIFWTKPYIHKLYKGIDTFILRHICIKYTYVVVHTCILVHTYICTYTYMWLCTYIHNYLYVEGNIISAKDAIKKFNTELLEELPLDNPMFSGEAKKADLFPPGTAASIAAMLTRAEKVAYFLQHVVEPGADDYLPKLLKVMKDSKVDNVVKLADKIQARTDPGKCLCIPTYIFVI